MVLQLVANQFLGIAGAGVRTPHSPHEHVCIIEDWPIIPVLKTGIGKLELEE